MTLASTSGESGASRASTVAERLNAIFGNTARDLDFITPTFYNNNHEVVCADVTCPNGCTCFACDDLSSSNCPNLNTATCSGQTQGLPENIYDTDNSTNDLSGSQAYIVTATSADVSATGKASMANGDVFHRCDVTVAVPSSTYDAYKNEWVRVYYGSASVVARITDISPDNDIDLTYQGVAQPLSFPGSGIITLKAT